MGKKTLLLPLASALLLLLLQCFVACITPAFSLANLADESALVAIKDQIITLDPNNILATNWSKTTSYCNWIGVYCNSPQQERVTDLNLSSMALQGTIPPQIGNLSFLISLDISHNNFFGHLPDEIGKLQNLQILYAVGNHISGTIPRSIGNLSKLEELYLDNNSLTGAIPMEISNLFNFKNLSFPTNNLTGSIPSSIFNISLLLSISFSTNSLSGTLPMNMCYNLPNLRGLYLSNNQLSGHIPTSLHKCTELRQISLSYNEFSGSVPRGFGKLSKLHLLALGINNLTGEIPHDVFTISSLRVFDISTNRLLGTIPAGLCDSLPSLELINLSNNRLKGEIPSSLPQCRALQIVSLSVNQFTGSIPQGIGNLSELQELYLGFNNLAGGIPRGMSNLVNLQILSLHINKLTGPVPEAIFNISSLLFISLAENHLSGNLPSRIDLLLPNIEELLIGRNEFSGKIPSSICNNSKLTKLDLTDNFFTSYVPVDLGNLRLLQYLSFGDNQLTSEPLNPELSFLHSLTNCIFLKVLWIGSNRFNGMLPTSFTNLSKSLTSIDMTACQIKGMIPTGISNLTNLVDLGMGENDFTGLIPTTLGQLRKLQRLYITGSRIHGSIPDSICHSASLGELLLSSNKISGSIPSCLGNLTTLRLLSLDSNALTSTIPSSLWSLKDLLVLNLSSNFLSSHLPLEVGEMKSIINLDVSKNQVSGNIPSTIGKLQNLLELSLSKNRLQGSIPQTFGDMVSLESLDLSWNNLTGELPKSLDALIHLKYLNLSFNKLQGAIPNGGPFANFTADAFMSNDALCGAPKFKVRPCDIHNTKGSRNTKLLLLKYILPSVVAIIIAVTFIALLIGHRKREPEIPKADSALPKTLRQISYYELIRATNNFDEEFLVGTGSLGTVYKGVLSDGSNIAIKVFNLELQGAFKSFDTECVLMRNIRHRNLVKIISSCSNNDFKALVVEYMPNGSLDKWLYSHNYCLNMVQRLDIMINVASALEYLHHEYTTPVVHCDLKPSNVLLDEDMVAHIGDFGISKLLTENESMVQIGTIGYMAPEYGSEGRVSTMGDVYSYGIMLMETFTRKRPTDVMFAGELSLKNWVVSLVGAVMELVDANLLRREDKHFAAKEKCVSSIMILALECTIESPEERISMKGVAARLKKIRIETIGLINTQRRH